MSEQLYAMSEKLHDPMSEKLYDHLIVCPRICTLEIGPLNGELSAVFAYQVPLYDLDIEPWQLACCIVQTSRHWCDFTAKKTRFVGSVFAGETLCTSSVLKNVLRVLIKRFSQS